MTDPLDDYIDNLNEAFAIAKRRATDAAEEHNRHLPTSCPTCSEPSYVCGLTCVTCGETEPNGWVVVIDTESGYALAGLGKTVRQPPIATYRVDA